METLIAFDLTVIAVCSVAITVGIVVLLVIAYRVLKKVEESVDTVNNQLKPAVLELKATVSSITESLQVVSSTLSFVKKLKGKKNN